MTKKYNKYSRKQNIFHVIFEFPYRGSVNPSSLGDGSDGMERPYRKSLPGR
jgi:hypothetical protein